MSDTARKIANFVLFQLGWFACVLPAASSRWWIGPAAAAAIVAAHVTWLAPRAGRELRMIATLGTLGCAIDVGQAALGSLQFAPAGWHVLGLPLWMAALWFLFASILDCSLRWMQGRYVVGVVLGAVAGPLAYVAGEGLGALTLPTDDSRTSALVALGVGWALYMPLALWAAPRLTRSLSRP